MNYTIHLIPNQTNYWITKEGDVFSKHSGSFKKLKPSEDKHGRLRVSLGKGNTQYVHRLVLLTFVGKCPKGMECCHNDGNPKNNNLSNLRWDTSKANTDDQRKHGTLVNRKNHGMSKLTDEDIKKIKSLYGMFNQYELAKDFGVSQATISRILKS